MRIIKILVGIFTFAALFFITRQVYAIEGTVELESTGNEPYRCWAAFVRLKNQEYRIPFSCKNLLYPVADNVFNYVMWTTPSDGSKPVKLGLLSLGSGEFRTKKAFSELYVTTESQANTRSPTGRVVMRGDVLPIEFLEEIATPTPEQQETDEEIVSEEEIQDNNLEEPQQELTTRERLVLALRRAGIAALFA